MFGLPSLVSLNVNHWGDKSDFTDRLLHPFYGHLTISCEKPNIIFNAFKKCAMCVTDAFGLACNEATSSNRVSTGERTISAEVTKEYLYKYNNFFIKIVFIFISAFRHLKK